MKKIIFFLSAIAMLASCSGGDKTQPERTDSLALLEATRQDLVEAIDERDQLIQLVNDISASTEEIKEMEKIVSINIANGEKNKSTQITANLEALKSALAERRQRLAELEEKLKKSNTSNKQLLATIDQLKAQIASQDSEITELKSQLDNAKQHIAQLDNKVDSLNTQVSEVTQARDAAQTEAKKQEELANACYIAIGSKDELKAHNIIEGGGFLRKTKVMPGDYDKTFFRQADKRTLTTIPLHSKKAKVMTSFQPKTSYEIVEVEGSKVLKILNAKEFWGVSNFLVIQID